MGNFGNVYTRTSNRERAVTLLRAWLRAVDITVHETQDADFAIESIGGCQVKVQVVEGAAEVASDVLRVSAEELRCSRFSDAHLADTRRPLEIALSAFWAVTEATGYGRPLPVDRGAEPEAKLWQKEDDWLISFRHTEFRRAPNPPPEKYTQYAPILKRQTAAFLATNRDLCDAKGYEYDDLYSLAQFALSNFCAHHERVTNVAHENEKILTVYVKQRFAELRKSWCNQCRNAPASPLYHDKTDLISDYRSVEDYWAKETERSIDEVYAAGHVDAIPLDEAEEEETRVWMRRHIASTLGNMSHEEMIEKLLEISYSDDADPDTQKLATKALVAHCRECTECSNRAKMNKKTAGSRSRSVEEQLFDFLETHCS